MVREHTDIQQHEWMQGEMGFTWRPNADEFFKSCYERATLDGRTHIVPAELVLGEKARSREELRTMIEQGV